MGRWPRSLIAESATGRASGERGELDPVIFTSFDASIGTPDRPVH